MSLTLQFLPGTRASWALIHCCPPSIRSGQPHHLGPTTSHLPLSSFRSYRLRAAAERPHRTPAAAPPMFVLNVPRAAAFPPPLLYLLLGGPSPEDPCGTNTHDAPPPQALLFARGPQLGAAPHAPPRVHLQPHLQSRLPANPHAPQRHVWKQSRPIPHLHPNCVRSAPNPSHRSSQNGTVSPPRSRKCYSARRKGSQTRAWPGSSG